MSGLSCSFIIQAKYQLLFKEQYFILICLIIFVNITAIRLYKTGKKISCNKQTQIIRQSWCSDWLVVVVGTRYIFWGKMKEEKSDKTHDKIPL